MSQILYINTLVDWSVSGIMTSKLVIRESESPRPAASSILISRMTSSSVIIPYRAIFLDQGELSEQIISATNAHQVLQIAKNLPYSPLWDKHKLTFMDTLLELKYEQCEEFRVKLQQRGSSKSELTVPDMFWGTGNRGNRKNHFGNLLQNLSSKILK